MSFILDINYSEKEEIYVKILQNINNKCATFIEDNKLIIQFYQIDHHTNYYITHSENTYINFELFEYNSICMNFGMSRILLKVPLREFLNKTGLDFNCLNVKQLLSRKEELTKEIDLIDFYTKDLQLEFM